MYMLVDKMIEHRLITKSRDALVVEHNFTTDIKSLTNYKETIIPLNQGIVNKSVQYKILDRINDELVDSQITYDNNKLLITFSDDNRDEE